MPLVITSSTPASGVLLWEYNNLDTADTTPASIRANGTTTIIGSIQAVGTFGSGTVKLQGSNDGTNWADLDDTQGTAVGLAAAGAAEFSTGMVYIRPLVTGGTGDDLDVFISLRG